MITWKITRLESVPLTGIVLSAGWECSNEQVNRSGTSVFNEPIETIIPYSNLTEDIVLNWVWTDGGVDKQLVEDSVAKELNSIINPILVKNPLPWTK